MKVYRRLFGTAHPAGVGARLRRGDVRLELFSLLAVLLVGALALGATSVSAEEDGTTGDPPTAGLIVAGGAGELVGAGERGIFIQGAEAGPPDAEFEECMREQGVELPGPSLEERFATDDSGAPSLESSPLDEAFIEAAEQCGHTLEVFTHEAGNAAPNVTAEEIAAFHECLSAAGVDLPQGAPPTGDAADGAMALHLVVGASNPDQQAAFEQCAALLPESVVTVGATNAD